MSLLRAMTTVAGLTALSRIAGFARDVLTAAILGAGPVADAFFVALKLPNFFRRVTAEGAFSVSFVPIYSETLEQKGQTEADYFANNVFLIMLGILSLFCLLAMIVMPSVIYVIAPGFSEDEIRLDLAVQLARITFPYLLLMSLTALLGGVLNALNRFAPFAFAPVLFNLCLIAALLSSSLFETAGHAMAYGVLAAGLVQFVWLLICAYRSGVQLSFTTPKFDEKARRVLKLMGPGVIGAGVMHINLFADLILASFLKEGSISYLYYADRLNQLPLGVVGIAVGTALLPMLSKTLAAKKMDEAKSLFNRALEYCLILALPASVALLVMPNLLISVLFERGEFGSDDTVQTAYVLMGYAIGLPAYIAIKVFSTAHWARQDTMTAVKIAIFATIINITLSIILIQYIGVAGISLSTGLTAWIQFYGHIRALRDHPAVAFDRKFAICSVKIIFSALFMGVFLSVFAVFLHDIEGWKKMIALIFGGFTVYVLMIVSTGAISFEHLGKRKNT